MPDNITIKHNEWLSTTGFKQEAWEITRDGLLLGQIVFSDWRNKYMATIDTNLPKAFKSKYFVKFDAAVKWLDKQSEFIRPISELNKYLA